MAARPWSLLASTASRPRARAAVRPRPSSRLRPRPSSPSSSMPERARSPSSVSPAATSRGSSPRQRPDPPPRALPRAPVAGAAQPGPCPSPFSLWFPLSLLISPLFLFSQGTKSHGALVPSPRKRTISAAADLVGEHRCSRASLFLLLLFSLTNLSLLPLTSYGQATSSHHGCLPRPSTVTAVLDAPGHVRLQIQSGSTASAPPLVSCISGHKRHHRSRLLVLSPALRVLCFPCIEKSRGELEPLAALRPRLAAKIRGPRSPEAHSTPQGSN